MGAMRRIKNFVPVATLETVYKGYGQWFSLKGLRAIPVINGFYKGLVQPYFKYCSPLRDTCGKLLKDKLQWFQSRAARVLTGASHDIRFADLIDSLSWQALDDPGRCAKTILMS